jgi:integrase/recombinase XerD
MPAHAAPPPPPPPLRDLVADYLRVRRALGFKLEYTERLLFAFVEYLHDQGAATVTVEHAVAFATAPAAASARWQALRLSAIRLFARWAHLMDPSVEVPPARLLPARVTRAAPYLYSDDEIAALLVAAAALAPAIRAATMTALISLMAATGIRTGEALALDVTDIDQRTGALTVTGKYGKTRMLPLHPSVLDGLTGYLDQRDKLLPAAQCPALLISTRGKRLRPQSVHPTFRALADQVGVVASSSAGRPRLHDLRHRFAVATMLDAYRNGGDPAATLPVLATWLGHADPNDTYWYLTGTAELMAAATDRLHAAEQAGRAVTSAGHRP